EVQRRDLEMLRRIRNTFAHSWEDVSIDNQDIANRIREMSVSRIDEPVDDGDLRHKFLRTMICTITEIRVFTMEMRDRRQNASLKARHLAILGKVDVDEGDGFTFDWEHEEDRLEHLLKMAREDATE